jgi:hypothetical protein
MTTKPTPRPSPKGVVIQVIDDDDDDCGEVQILKPAKPPRFPPSRPQAASAVVTRPSTAYEPDFVFKVPQTPSTPSVFGASTTETPMQSAADDQPTPVAVNPDLFADIERQEQSFGDDGTQVMDEVDPLLRRSPTSSYSSASTELYCPTPPDSDDEEDLPPSFDQRCTAESEYAAMQMAKHAANIATPKGQLEHVMSFASIYRDSDGAVREKRSYLKQLRRRRLVLQQKMTDHIQQMCDLDAKIYLAGKELDKLEETRCTRMESVLCMMEQKAEMDVKEYNKGIPKWYKISTVLDD